MPNWCYNNITITATPDKIKEIIQYAENNEFLKCCQNYDEWDYGMFVDTYGTKWEPSIDYIDNQNDQVTLGFDSAWAPPIAAYDLLLQQEGVDDITGGYSEPGMGFVGIYESGTDYELSIEDIAKKVQADEDLDPIEAQCYEYCEGEVEWLIETWAEEAEEEE